MRKQRPMRLTFQSFFISIFAGLQEKPRYEANQKSNSEGGANPYVHLNEKIARQTDSKNRFANITNIFGKVFQPGFVENSHRHKDYHIEEKLSRFIDEYGTMFGKINGNRVLKFFNTSNVGIGTTTPAQAFEISKLNNSANIYTLRISNPSTQGFHGGLEFWDAYNAGAFVAGVRVQIAGGGNGTKGGVLNVNVADNTPTLQNRFQIVATGIVQMGAYGAGTATFDASGNISSVSDERLKNIQGNLKYGLKEILQIHPILFKWNKRSGLDTDHIYTGFSAQEIQKLIPETVGQGKDGYLSLSDRGIEGALVNATKELAKENRDLNARNKEFEERLKALEDLEKKK